MMNQKLLTMVILAAFVTGCAPTAPSPKTETVSGIPRPLFPSEKVEDEIFKKFEAEPANPFWIYFHDDLQNKCAQERVLGHPCAWMKN